MSRNEGVLTGTGILRQLMQNRHFLITGSSQDRASDLQSRGFFPNHYPFLVTAPSSTDELCPSCSLKVAYFLPNDFKLVLAMQIHEYFRHLELGSQPSGVGKSVLSSFSFSSPSAIRQQSFFILSTFRFTHCVVSMS